MNAALMSKPKILLLCLTLGVLGAAIVYFAHPSDSSQMDTAALPEVPAGFEAKLFAKEPLVGNPGAMAFDGRGRLFVGMGPQYRNPKPETPGDRVVILLDADGDGVADKTKDFATGLNSIQGLAWHGRDLWIANAPDLTIARDLDGDDEADEYVRVYTDLGNLEHALHGLIWGPDGKIYMTKGNSKGLTLPVHLAPKPFRDLWGVSAPDGAPDFPPPQTFKKGEYQHAYHDPDDDWGREGGFLRCDDMGANLEIVSRGLRNPFDIVFDSGFNWLGTDNDQHEGDRIVMPFAGAHFGWGQGWSAHWTGERNPPTVPVSGPLFDGSSTGVVFYDAPQFPPEWRGVWLMNDYERKRTFAYRARWDGALMQPEGGAWKEFVAAGRALFRPTDMEIGPDGALWILSWGKQYNRPQKLVRGLLGKTEELEGRVFRIVWKDAPLLNWRTAKRERPIDSWSFAELAEDLGSHVPIWRVDAQEELLRRGPAVKSELLRLLATPELPQARETWALWTLGRMGDAALDEDFAAMSGALNRRIQALRILAHRARTFSRPLPKIVAAALRDPEPRIRFEAVQAVRQAHAVPFVEELKSLASAETDRLTFYAAWGALRDLAGADALHALLADPRGGVRRAALLALADLGQLRPEVATALISDAATSEIAALWLAKRSGNPFITFEPQPGEFEREVTVWLTPGVKPSEIRYTLDGSTPTEQSPVFPESTSIVLRATTTVKAALFVENKLIGDPATAVFSKQTGTPAAPLALAPRAHPTTAAETLAALKSAHPERGRALFSAASCATCHRAGALGRAFGPDLSNIGERNDPEQLIRSILEPDAAITEGFALQSVGTREGGSYIGVLREETDLHLALAQADGRIVRIDKTTITARESLHTSAMPPFATLLSPAQVADLVGWLMTLKPVPNSTAVAN
ncbi:MAG: PVC-type heme-binding CxxCH protein [Chthoniobacteraceae bacterium]